MTDYTVSTVPWTIQLRPSRLVAMLLAAVVITAALTWSLADISLDSGSQTRDAAPAVATQHDLHAAYAGTYAGRTVPVSADHALAAATLAAGVTPAAMGMTLTPEIVAGAYGGGTGPVAMSLTPEIVAGAYGGGHD
jgi:hypothetical protein